jgi:hypothetical protein
MFKGVIYISLILFCFTSCEDAYHPKIDTVEGHLVVEALITNDPSQNYVLLTKTTSFYANDPAEAVTGASITLVDGTGNMIKGIESSSGYFIFNTVPVTGLEYKLQISFNNDLYESEPVKMPPIPSITNFYTDRIEKTEYETDSYGVPIPYKVIGRELYLDAPMTSSLSNYRFTMRSVLEWTYSPPMMGHPLPTVYGWLSINYNDNYNIAGPKKFSQTDKIEKQPLVILPYSTSQLLKPDSAFAGWIFILNQFGTSQGSYNYHEKLNNQFSADGSLFDPIQTQVYGNITCKTDPSKITYGYFDLNSYKQYRYYLYFTDPSPKSSITIREITRYPYISSEGQTIEYPPDWWE